MKRFRPDLNFQLAKLIEFSETGHLYGSAKGDEVYKKLSNRLLVLPRILEISLEGIESLDVCFVRNSIANLTKYFCDLDLKGTYLSHVENNDVLDNLIYGYHARKIPLIIRKDDGSADMYGDISSGGKLILSYAYNKKNVTTNHIMKHFDLSAPNASAKLKKLHKAGYLLAEKCDAATGGIEYVYSPFFTCSSISYPSPL